MTEGHLTYAYETMTVDLDDGHFDVTTTCRVYAGKEMVAMGSCQDSTHEYVFASQIQNLVDAGVVAHRVAVKLVEMQRAVSRIDAIEKMSEETKGGMQ